MSTQSQSEQQNTWQMLNADGGAVEHLNEAESLFRTAELALTGEQLEIADLQDIQRAISVARQKLTIGIDKLQTVTDIA